jgi:cytochrome c551/c552
MRAKALLAVFAVLALAGCGSAKIVSPKPETVIGSVPKQTAPATTSTTATTTTTTGTTSTPSGGGGGAASGKSVFAKNGCGSCHTFKAAGSNGKIGPDLDKLAQYAKQAKQPLDKFVRESISDPKAYVQPGYQPIMPSFANLSEPELTALVQFLTKGS